MNIYDAIKDLEAYKKKVIMAYRMACANADFDNVKHPSRNTFYSIKLMGYIQYELYPIIDKQELSQAIFYYLNNIPLGQTNEYKYLNAQELKFLEMICWVGAAQMERI